MEWTFSLLMEEHPGLFSAGMQEKQEDHQLCLRLALPQTGPSLISSWGCLHPSCDGRGGRTRSISPVHSFLLPTHEDISGTEDTFIYPLLVLCPLPALPGCPPEISGEETERGKEYFFFHLHICFQQLPHHLGTVLEMGKKT